MKRIQWNLQKNLELLRNRGISFEDLLNAKFMGIEEHPRKPHQRYMVFEYNKYIWIVPYVVYEEGYFLKTAFPSRKHTKKYLGGS